jgi:hypothetical protein
MVSYAKVLMFCFTIFIVGKTNSQISMDVYGTIPIKKCGWGLGTNVFSPGLSFGNFEMRVGGSFYWSSLVHRKIDNVPLLAPQTGDAKIRLTNNIFGLDGVLRLSLPYDKDLIPYVDLFVGRRFFTANMNITPNTPANNNTNTTYTTSNSNYQNSTSQSLCSINQFNYGATIGILASLSESVKFTAGIMYTYSPEIGEVVDVKKTRLEGGAIVSENMNTVHGMFIAKVGFTFIFNDSGSSSGTRGHVSHSRSGSGSGFGGLRGGGAINRVPMGGIKPRT